MPHLDYYFATISPFTYLVGNRLEKIAKTHGASITYKPLAIVALFGRTGGVAPKDRHPNRQEYRLQELRRQSAKTGLPLNLKPAHWPTNGAPAAYAIIAAQKEGGGDIGKLVAEITASVWARDLDIAQDEVVRQCLTAAGFDPAIADKGLFTAADTYEANLEDAVAKGVFGAPFFITDTDERFWGQDRLEDLDLYLAGKL